MKKEKKVCDIKFMNMIIEELSKAPSTEASKSVIERCDVFRKVLHTPGEKYDFIVEISKLPIKSDEELDLGIGDISHFVHTLCDLERFYLRPE